MSEGRCGWGGSMGSKGRHGRRGKGGGEAAEMHVNAVSQSSALKSTKMPHPSTIHQTQRELRFCRQTHN